MKVALITDTHFGVRNDSPIFMKYFDKFYGEFFFPYLVENKIDRIIHLGDIVDKRKQISFLTLNNLKRNFFDQLRLNKIYAHIVIGNHDTYFKNTNKINAMEELFGGYDEINASFYPGITNLIIDDVKILFIPWINPENHDESMSIMKSSDARYAFGHLEVDGFKMYKKSIESHGLKRNIFNKFDMVFSGHYHHKSKIGNVQYLGSPYEMTWSDFDDPKGFHIFDLKTGDLEFVQNPYPMFHKIEYDEDQTYETEKFSNGYVKLYTKNKKDQRKFDKFLENLESQELADLQIIEDQFDISTDEVALSTELDSEIQDTRFIISSYVKNIDSIEKPKKEKVSKLLDSLYNKALSDRT